MVSKILRSVGIIFGGLVVLLAAAATGIYIISSSRLGQVYSKPDVALSIPPDAAAIARGQHLAAAATHCTGCHGENLAGQVMIDAPPFQVVASNLTRGQGGVGGSFSDADWVRAIRYGIRPDGTSMIIMPSPEFHNLSDADLAAIIAYAKSVPPVDSTLPKTTLRPLGRALLVAGQLDVLVAPKIDQAAPRPAAIAAGATPAYGGYLVSVGGCQACHGGNLGGGVIPDGSGVHAPAINRGGLPTWSEADFVRAMREGVTPNGQQLSSAMPWRAVGQLSDDELRAVWLYLQSLPANP